MTGCCQKQPPRWLQRVSKRAGCVGGRCLVAFALGHPALAEMAAVRTLMQTSLPRWSWSDAVDAGNVSFVITHDRSMDVILNNQRGEGFVKQIFRLLLMGCQRPGAGSVLDIGSNTGYYSMASAAHGCPVLAVDAQPGCRPWFEWARSANDANFSRSGNNSVNFFERSRVRLVTQPVSHDGTPVAIDQWACWVMHKIDVRAKRRRRQAASLPPPVASVTATASIMPPPPPPLAIDMDVHTPPGKLALRPVSGAGLLRRLPPSEPILLCKVDTEGAELGVLHALEPLLPRVANLLVEVAPGWWPLYANKTSRRGQARSGGSIHGAQSADVAAALAVRVAGADQLSRLLVSKADGGWGFSAALTSESQSFTTADGLREYLMRMGNNGYWNQVDLWVTRDATLLRRAVLPICLQQQSTQRARLKCKGYRRRREEKARSVS